MLDFEDLNSKRLQNDVTLTVTLRRSMCAVYALVSARTMWVIAYTDNVVVVFVSVPPHWRDVCLSGRATDPLTLHHCIALCALCISPDTAGQVHR